MSWTGDDLSDPKTRERWKLPVDTRHLCDLAHLAFWPNLFLSSQSGRVPLTVSDDPSELVELEVCPCGPEEHADG